MPWIELIVSPTGESVVQTREFEGAACRQASQFLEAALGAVSNEQLTSEFYEVQISTRLTQSEGL